MVSFIFFALLGFAQASVWDNLTVNLAVLEYQPVGSHARTPQERVLVNTIQYIEHVISLSVDKSYDLIVFPEAALQTGTETAVEVSIGTTCDSSTTCSSPLQEISFVARTYRTYVVINLAEKAKCEESDQSSNCKTYGFRFYNTDVVFDRKGTIINKYRKYNLFGERDMDKPETADEVVIRTDFGVNFAIFTCFDILFKSPTQDVLSQDVQGAIFPSMWFSELPFFTAIQVQQMWAQRHDVTLLAAGANNPSVGSGGSGIYRGTQGAVSSGIVAAGGSQPFVYWSVNGKVPPSPKQDVDDLAKTLDSFHLKRDLSVDDHTSVLLNTSAPVSETRVCHENLLCCNFTIKLSRTTPTAEANVYTYHLVAYSGVRSFYYYYGGVETCGILACLNSSLSSCGKRFQKYDTIEWPLTFEEITVSANFQKNVNKTEFPNSLLSSLRPIEVGQTEWKQEEVGDVLQTTFSTTVKQNRLLTFGIYGRDFGLDHPPTENVDDSGDDGTNSGRFFGFTTGAVFGCVLLVALLINKM